jgi:hypothetical protein
MNNELPSNVTEEQRRAIQAFVHIAITPLIEEVIVKKLGQAAIILRDELSDKNARAAVEQAKPTTAADRVCECGGQRAHLAGDPGYSCKSPPAAQPAQVTEAMVEAGWEEAQSRNIEATKDEIAAILTAAQQPGGE